MAAKNKRPTTVVTNSGYCVSTAVSDFVLMLSCVYGHNILRQFITFYTVLSRGLENVPGKLE